MDRPEGAGRSFRPKASVIQDCRMYVCICNCLTERAVRETVARRRVGSVDELFSALEVEPVCGHCMDFADEIIEEAGQDNQRREPELCVVNGR